MTWSHRYRQLLLSLPTAHPRKLTENTVTEWILTAEGTMWDVELHSLSECSSAIASLLSSVMMQSEHRMIASVGRTALWKHGLDSRFWTIINLPARVEQQYEVDSSGCASHHVSEPSPGRTSSFSTRFLVPTHYYARHWFARHYSLVFASL
jgi:hypothetical protein